MKIKRIAFLTLAGMLLWAISCGDDNPTTPNDGNGGGGGTKNTAPGVPTIDIAGGSPGDGATDQALSSIVRWNCTDPDGDALTYDVYFGTSATPAEVASDIAGKSYNPGGLNYSTTYYWKIEATDPDTASTSSPVWMFTTMAQPLESITDPNEPTGPATGETTQILNYETRGATSSFGHTLEYRFDWGNGSFSTWAASMAQSYAWPAAGSYTVKVQARCAQHTTVESSWSTGLSVTINDALETISAPGGVLGTGSGNINTSYNYQAYPVAISSLGHEVEYAFEWNDGTISDWGANGTASHAWDAPGDYDVRCKARCTTHTTAESGWSPVRTVSIAGEVIAQPAVTSAPDYGQVGADINFYASYGVSSLGHSVEYRYDFGDGNTGAWASLSSATHAFASAGTYDVKVQARCSVHTTIESAWSDLHSIVITDTEIISMPVINPSSELTIPVGQNSTTMTITATSSFGHPLEYQWDWGDVTPVWETGSFFSHNWSVAGDYNVTVTARCRDHTTIVSSPSAPRVVHVMENVTRPDVSGPVTATVNTLVHFTSSGATSSEGHDLEYRLYISTSSAFLGNPQPWTALDELDYTFTDTRPYYVRVQARCIQHQTESLPSLSYHTINIVN